MIKFQQSQALTSHFESFWSIVPYYFLSLDCNFLANSGSRVDANGHHGQLFYFGWPFVLAFTRNFRSFTTWDHWRNRLVEAKRQKFFPMLVKSQTPDSNARTWKGQEKVTLTKFTTYTVRKFEIFSNTRFLCETNFVT